jgi:hypothetical protein
MPFTTKEFPGQVFNNLEEYGEAKRRRREVESRMSKKSEETAQVTATVIPAPKALLERKVVSLERQISDLTSAMEKLVRSKAEPPPKKKINKEGLEVGTILQGESRGRKYTLEVLDEDYLCSDGTIYQSLSGAALGVSGNRRSGWKFWRDIEGKPIGTITGRFKSGSRGNPFRTERMS